MTNIAKFRPYNSTKILSNGLFDDLFNRSIADFIGSDTLTSQPAVNIAETEAAFLIELAAPGFDKQEFSLKVEQDNLMISAEKESKEEEKNERYARREFRFESFKRSFKLPETVNQADVSAVYENGVLKVTLPKKDEAKSVVKTVAIQ